MKTCNTCQFCYRDTTGDIWCVRLPEWLQLDKFAVSVRVKETMHSAAYHYCGEWREKRDG